VPVGVSRAPPGGGRRLNDSARSRHTLRVTPESWPSPQEPSREPLPRVEDLPVADQGYEQDSVKAAFDSFYRHAAQLDAALRTLEAVDSFHRQAAGLRADLRALRTAGWTQQPWGPPPAYGYAPRSPREGISPAVWRIAGEVALIIAVAVGLGVAKVAWWVIVLVLGLTWLLVAAIEWAASRDRWAVGRPSVPISGHPVVEGAAGRTEEDEALGWSAFEAAQEPSDAMTMIGAPSPDEVVVPEPSVDDEVESDAVEPEALGEDSEPARGNLAAEQEDAAAALAPETEPSRRRWWHRSKSEEEEVPPQPEPPRHVRVLESEAAEPDPAASVDPWERGFDDEADRAGGDDEVEPVEGTDEDWPAMAAEHGDPARRRFRRR
jgi:hypothetical protein